MARSTKTSKNDAGAMKLSESGLVENSWKLDDRQRVRGSLAIGWVRQEHAAETHVFHDGDVAVTGGPCASQAERRGAERGRAKSRNRVPDQDAEEPVDIDTLVHRERKLRPIDENRWRDRDVRRADDIRRWENERWP